MCQCLLQPRGAGRASAHFRKLTPATVQTYSKDALTVRESTQYVQTRLRFPVRTRRIRANDRLRTCSGHRLIVFDESVVASDAFQSETSACSPAGAVCGTMQRPYDGCFGISSSLRCMRLAISMSPGQLRSCRPACPSDWSLVPAAAADAKRPVFRRSPTLTFRNYAPR